VSDLISELDILGIISAQIVSKGRYGRTKEIKLNIHPTQVRAAIQDDYYINGVEVLTPSQQVTQL
jgi:cell division control protein 6